MFEVTGVSKTFGDLQALREVDLSVQAKQTTVLIGPSGCGKSTLIRQMSRFNITGCGRWWMTCSISPFTMPSLSIG